MCPAGQYLPRKREPKNLSKWYRALRAEISVVVILRHVLCHGCLKEKKDLLEKKRNVEKYREICTFLR